MPTDLIAGLKALRLFGMADALNDMAEQASPRYQHALPILEGLLQAEKADREVVHSSTSSSQLNFRFTAIW